MLRDIHSRRLVMIRALSELRGLLGWIAIALMVLRVEDGFIAAVLNPWLLVPLLGAWTCDIAMDRLKQRSIDEDHGDLVTSPLTTEPPTRS